MWVEESQKGILLHIKLQPKASRSEIVGLYGDPPRLKIRLAAPPVDGKANQELLRFLSKTLKLSLSQVILIRGDKSSKKDVLLTGVSIEKIRECLNTWDLN